jgi:PIN domain nuclease of toxin-antitoxin system
LRLLLDTHALLWFVLDDTRLSGPARNAIADSANEVLVSPATLWEIAIKVSLGKYRLPGEYGQFMKHQLAMNDFDVLPIEIPHTAMLANMPFHHRDPFDRLLVAQAIVEPMPLVSSDVALDSYGVNRLW